MGGWVDRWIAHALEFALAFEFGFGFLALSHYLTFSPSVRKV